MFVYFRSSHSPPPRPPPPLTLQCGLNYFDTVFYTPIYSSFFMVMGSLSGVCILGDADHMTTLQCVLFSLGLAITCSGTAYVYGRIVTIASRHSPRDIHVCRASSIAYRKPPPPLFPVFPLTLMSLNPCYPPPPTPFSPLLTPPRFRRYLSRREEVTTSRLSDKTIRCVACLQCDKCCCRPPGASSTSSTAYTPVNTDEEDMEDTSLVMPGEHGFSRSGSIN
jgi:hypothetical protein